MEKAIRYLERILGTVIDIKISSTISSKCGHCGYGERITGDATILVEESNESGEESNESGEESSENEDKFEENIKKVTFSYYTGCLTYDEEMDYSEA